MRNLFLKGLPPSDEPAAPAPRGRNLFLEPGQTELDAKAKTALAHARAMADLEPIERDLGKHAWWPYRRMTPFERTQLFVQAYDQSALAFVMKFAEVEWAGWLRERKHYLRRHENSHPWIDPKSVRVGGRWQRWLTTRRWADFHGAKYEDWCVAGFASARSRGWGNIPDPRQLSSDRLLGKADLSKSTIPNYLEALYADQVKACWADPYFHDPAQWVGCEIQKGYMTHLAADLVRVKKGERAAERAWRAYQKDGKIPLAVGFADALRSFTA